MEQRIESAITADNYGALSDIFSSSYGGLSWQSIGQGEQRTLSAYFVKAALSSPTFLPKAFNSEDALQVMKTTLGHLPPSVENAMDNELRQKMFDHLVEEEDYRGAAGILSTLRMESQDTDSPYYKTPAERTDVYVKISECFLNEDDIVEAETFVTRAGTAVESIGNENAEQHLALILRYKSTYARVLDANRKFQQAAGRYYDLSQLGNTTDIIDTDDLVEFLGRAATCAILAPSGSQRHRILGLVYKDDRLSQLDSIPHFSTHSSILSKMYKAQVIKRDNDLVQFEESLAEHQKALMSDGLTIMERALIEHNMVAIGQLYSTIYISALGQLLGVSSDRGEKIASKMILDGSLIGSIDQVDGILTFGELERSELVAWDEAITSFCTQLNGVTDAVRQLA